MAVNKSTNKVKVTRLFGGSASLGYMDPEVDMQVKHGISDYWIVALQSGNFTVDLALTSGGSPVRRAYPFELVVDAPVASGFGWPSSTDSVKAGHEGIFPNGVPGPYELSGSGMAYAGGDGTIHLFSR